MTELRDARVPFQPCQVVRPSVYSVHGGRSVCGIGRVKEGSAREGEKERERESVCVRERVREREIGQSRKTVASEFILSHSQNGT